MRGEKIRTYFKFSDRGTKKVVAQLRFLRYTFVIKYYRGLQSQNAWEFQFS